MITLKDNKNEYRQLREHSDDELKITYGHFPLNLSDQLDWHNLKTNANLLASKFARLSIGLTFYSTFSSTDSITGLRTICR